MRGSLKLISFEEFGKAFIPKKLRPKLHSYLLRAGLTTVPFRLFGGIFYLNLAMTLIAYLLFAYPRISVLEPYKFFLATLLFWIFLPLALSAVAMLLLYFHFDVKIYNRTQAIESQMPDYMRLVSENLRGGMPFDRSLWMAIRPEYGVLSEEMTLIAKRVMTGQDIEEAMQEFSQKYNSPITRRSVDLIVQGIKGGGQIADIIDRVVDNIKETRHLKAELSATNLSYIIFIAIVVMVVAPILYAFSYNFLIVSQNFGSKLGQASAAGGAGLALLNTLGEINVKPELFRQYSIYSIIVTGLFSSVLLSVIRKGDVRASLAIIPLIIAGSLIVYFLVFAVTTRIFE